MFRCNALLWAVSFLLLRWITSPSIQGGELIFLCYRVTYIGWSTANTYFCPLSAGKIYIWSMLSYGISQVWIDNSSFETLAIYFSIIVDSASYLSWFSKVTKKTKIYYIVIRWEISFSMLTLEKYLGQVAIIKSYVLPCSCVGPVKRWFKPIGYRLKHIIKSLTVPSVIQISYWIYIRKIEITHDTNVVKTRSLYII